MDVWVRRKIISSRKTVGAVWYVTQRTPSTKVGFFKYATSDSKQYSGPLAANEYVSYLLAKEVKLPVADIKLATVEGQFGSVSIKMRNGKLYNWDQVAEKHPNVIGQVLKPERLIKMFVFDIWIANIDRNNRNIILYEKSGAFDFYLIDHGLALLGSFQWKKRNWKSQYWNHVAKYNNRYLNGLPAYVLKNKTLFLSLVKDVQKVSDIRIKKVIGNVPRKLLSANQKRVLIQFLIKRKKQLAYIAKLWLSEFKVDKQ